MLNTQGFPPDPGSAAMGPSINKKGPDFHQDRFCGAEGARTLDLRRDRPAF